MILPRAMIHTTWFKVELLYLKWPAFDIFHKENMRKKIDWRKLQSNCTFRKNEVQYLHYIIGTLHTVIWKLNNEISKEMLSWKINNKDFILVWIFRFVSLNKLFFTILDFIHPYVTLRSSQRNFLVEKLQSQKYRKEIYNLRIVCVSFKFLPMYTWLLFTKPQNHMCKIIMKVK